MTDFKYIRGYYGFRCPCIYMVTITTKKPFVYEIAVVPTNGDGKVLEQDPVLVKQVRGWLRAKIEFNKVYKEYNKKVNGGNILLW